MAGRIRHQSGEARHRHRGGPRAIRPKTCWQLQTAKAQFSEVFRRARAEGPQWVTRQNKEAVVILPAEDFERLARRARQPASLVRFFAESPLASVRLDLTRKPDYGRNIEL
jgi:prevent-host-death family protein